jgi:rRNA maturation protein Rpf1
MTLFLSGEYILQSIVFDLQIIQLVLFIRHHVFVKIPPKQVQLAEVGPRFEMKRMLCIAIFHLLTKSL